MCRDPPMPPMPPMRLLSAALLSPGAPLHLTLTMWQGRKPEARLLQEIPGSSRGLSIDTASCRLNLQVDCYRLAVCPALTLMPLQARATATGEHLSSRTHPLAPAYLLEQPSHSDAPNPQGEMAMALCWKRSSTSCTGVSTQRSTSNRGSLIATRRAQRASEAIDTHIEACTHARANGRTDKQTRARKLL